MKGVFLMAYNRGQIYQNDLYQTYLSFPGCKKEHGVGSKKTDVVIETSIPIQVETKVRRSSNIAEFGSTVIHWDDNKRWFFPEEEVSGAPDIVSVLNSCGIIDELNSRWEQPAYELQEANKILQENKSNPSAQKKELDKYRKASQRINQRFKIDSQDQTSRITHDQLMGAMKNHYSDSDYIQINDKGLFRLGKNDPIAQMTNNKITFPEFNPGSGEVIFRLKSHGGLRHASYNAAIQFKYFPSAPQNYFKLNDYRTLSLRDLDHDERDFKDLFRAIQEGYFQNQS